MNQKEANRIANRRLKADALVSELLAAVRNSTDCGSDSPHYQLGYLSGIVATIVSKNPGSEDILISRIQANKDRAKVTETA
jgi:hypothetical protein